MQVLEDKFQQVKRAETYLDVGFSLEEIETLSDLGQLRAWKLEMEVPKGFQSSADIIQCFQELQSSDQFDFLRTLEFCVLKNAVLKKPVYQVFWLYFGGAYAYTRQ